MGKGQGVRQSLSVVAMGSIPQKRKILGPSALDSLLTCFISSHCVFNFLKLNVFARMKSLGVRLPKHLTDNFFKVINVASLAIRPKPRAAPATIHVIAVAMIIAVANMSHFHNGVFGSRVA